MSYTEEMKDSLVELHYWVGEVTPVVHRWTTGAGEEHRSEPSQPEVVRRGGLI